MADFKWYDPNMTQSLSVLMLLGRPGTAWPQTATYRPGSALKPQSAFRPPTAVRQSPVRESTPDSGRPSTSSRPVSNLSLGQKILIVSIYLCSNVLSYFVWLKQFFVPCRRCMV